ncbi:MAG: PQQ-binding-like beta-propeller repeat protein, partial [Saprospiraceae bacterium]|nr:PQQ-binding-like beta-propeller repeat protein [Saprospiraceae bacterium]
MKKHRFAYFLPSFLFSSSLFLITAIGAQESLWSVDLSSSLVEVGWIEQTNDGLIIAAGSKGTMAIDNNSGKQVWLNEELKSLTKPSFQNIEGLPLFFAEYAPLAGKARAVIVNSSTGEILYNTNDNNYRIKTYQIIPDQQIILFELTEGNSRLLMNFSLKNMKEQWIANLGEIKGLIGKMENATGRESFIDHGPVFTKENKILAAVGAKIYCINKETGTLEWDYEADKKLTAMVYSPQNNSIYLGVRKSKKLTVLDPAKGEDITPGKLKLKGSLVDIVGDDENIVLVETEGFNLIDPQTNDFIWKKSFKIDYLDEVMPFDKGYIAIGKDSKDGSIAYVSTDGEKIWDTKVKGYTYYAST